MAQGVARKTIPATTWTRPMRAGVVALLAEAGGMARRSVTRDPWLQGRYDGMRDLLELLSPEAAPGLVAEAREEEVAP